MKKQFIYIFGLTALFMTLSCHKAKKSIKDYYPVVETRAATITDDGDVIVEAQITSDGDQQLEYIGFCMDTLPDPNMMSNQVIIEELSGGNFTTKYDNISTLLPYHSFDPNKTYYFRSWATNGNGYSYGNTISLTNIKSAPVVPTCTLNTNQLNGSPYTIVTAPYNSSNNTWDFQAQSQFYGTLYFKFGSKMRSKVFTTINHQTPNENQVYVGFNSSEFLQSGSKVYVQETSPNNYEITICNAPYTLNSSTSYVNTRFVCPL
ncbi:MAG: hypothetical protein H0W73_14305 [Bacteroidetes bacterium]|nr:hypothetical protein [Bacteroidota bacterium]